MPILVVDGEASFHAPYEQCTIGYLKQAGVDATWMALGKMGIHGNGHMMMLEKNSDQIAAAMADWLDKAMPGQRAAR